MSCFKDYGENKYITFPKTITMSLLNNHPWICLFKDENT